MKTQLLENKVVIITGGAGLLGEAFAESVVENGGIAIVADIDLESAQKVAEKLTIRYQCESFLAIKVDITSKESLLSAISLIHKKFGKIDALVNNAYPRNKNYGRDFFDVDFSDFSENVSNNLGGYFLASQQIAKYFQQQKYGNIINIASVYGIVPPRFEIYDNTSMTTPVEYVAIKSALLQLTKYMTKYLKDENIRINSISPGGISDSQPKDFVAAYKKLCTNKGMLDKEDVCGSLVYLLSDLSAYVNGQNIIVDDGFSL